jgi:hypothetical protein
MKFTLMAVVWEILDVVADVLVQRGDSTGVRCD